MGLRWKKNEIGFTVAYWDRVHTDLLPRLDHMYAKAINYRFHQLGVSFLKFRISISVGYEVADKKNQADPATY